MLVQPSPNAKAGKTPATPKKPDTSKVRVFASVLLLHLLIFVVFTIFSYASLRLLQRLSRRNQNQTHRHHLLAKPIKRQHRSRCVFACCMFPFSSLPSPVCMCLSKLYCIHK